MRRKFLLMMLLVSSAVFFSACSSSVDGIGSVVKGDNSSNNEESNKPGGDNGTAGGDNGNIAGGFDDQLKEGDVNEDFTNPMNFVGRYRIVSLTVKADDGSVVLSQDYAKDIFKGNLGVDFDLAGGGLVVNIKVALKYQFHPTIVKSKPIEDRFEFFSKELASKTANLASYSGSLTDKITAIFKTLGAEVVDGKYVQFTLTHIDVPVNANEKMIILLEKVGNKSNLKLVGDGNRYWNNDGSETDKPELPVDNETVTPPDNSSDDDVIIPDEPVEGVTEINFNDLSTLHGHYEIIRFVSEANAPVVGKQVVASDDPTKVQRMQGELSITATSSTADAISKMQMDSSYLDDMGQGNEKYTYSVYPVFGIAGSILTNKDGDKIEPYGESKTLVKITQSFTKTVSGMNVPVNVTVTVKKISDTPKKILNKPYWGDGSGEGDPEKPTITPVDMTNDPASIEGNYKVSLVCYKYKRPSGGNEDICSSNPTVIQKMVGDLSIKYDGGASSNSLVTSKTQIQSSWFLGSLFTDSRWKFLYENKTKDYSIAQTGNKNEVKITFRRGLSYKAVITTSTVNTEINIWAEKISDVYKEIDGSKFF